jgi:hypothetical protein
MRTGADRPSAVGWLPLARYQETEMPAGKALWLTKKNGAFVIGPAPDEPPRANEIVVRARAVAVNPVDRYLPFMGCSIRPCSAPMSRAR